MSDSFSFFIFVCKGLAVEGDLKTTGLLMMIPFASIHILLPDFSNSDGITLYYIDCFCFNFNVFYICIEPGDHILSNYRHTITRYAYLNEF